MALHNSMAKGKVPQVLATRLLTKDRILVVGKLQLLVYAKIFQQASDAAYMLVGK